MAIGKVINLKHLKYKGDNVMKYFTQVLLHNVLLNY